MQVRVPAAGRRDRARTRLRSAAAVLAGGGALLGGALLAGCGGPSASSIAACHDVHQSLEAFQASLRATSASARATERKRASNELSSALQPTSLVASGDGQWQAMMATINENQNPGVPEGVLAPALLEQWSNDCRGIPGGPPPVYVSGASGGSGGTG
ncbi:MAG TPA: hypothetical protein VMD59_24335 [Acidimicrobiales bacterium]|nr:hypothetical protein [Acidimicrobiales bacterium]